MTYAMTETTAYTETVLPTPQVDNARLPACYESAKTALLPACYQNAKAALANCEQIDECQSWADKAAALASYARQAKDNQLLKMSTRIKDRAVRRAGELLKQIEPDKGGRPLETRVGAHPSFLVSGQSPMPACPPIKASRPFVSPTCRKTTSSKRLKARRHQLSPGSPRWAR